MHLENTLNAFLEAMNLGADGIELDVQITLDKEFVVFHDHNLKRLANYDIDINNINYEELKNIKLTNKNYNNKYNISLLSLVLSNMPKNSVINIELKESFLNENNNIYKNLLDLLNKYSNKFNIIISSFHIDIIKPLIKHKKEFKLAFLIDNKISLKELIKSINILKDIDFINPHINLIGKFLLKNIDKYNINLIIWGHKNISKKTYDMREKNISIISDVCEQFFNNK